MEEYINIIFAVFLSFKAGVCLMLSMVFWLIRRERNKIANFYISLYFLSYCLFSISDSLGTVNFFGYSPLLFEILNLPISLIPLWLYLFIYHFTMTSTRHPKWVYWLYLPMLLNIPFFLNFDAEVMYTYAPIYSVFVDGVLLLLTITVVVISFRQLRSHQTKIQTIYSTIENINLNWVYQLLIGIVISRMMILIISLDGTYNFLTIAADLIDFGLIIYLGYYGIVQKEIFTIPMKKIEQIDSNIQEKQQTKKSNSLIDNEDIIEQKNRILEVMEHQKPYLNPELTLPELARITKLKTKDLSYFLNQHFGENFYQFVNRYRVEKSKEILLAQEWQHLNMLGVAIEAGFNSKTAFNTNFKKLTHQTPSVYKKAHLSPKDVRLDANEHTI